MGEMQTEIGPSQKVLLESGTNEVEILEFYLGGQSYGINVSKVLQIVAYERERFTATPDADPTMPGVLLWRGDTIPLIDLAETLKLRTRVDSERPIVLVTEFNAVTNGFMVDGVNRIHRVSWEQIDPANTFLDKYSARVTGSVHVGEEDILLVDFEYIVAELSPETNLAYRGTELAELEESPESRGEVRVVFAEDSPFIRDNVIKLLHQAGYTQVADFENGRLALDYIARQVREAEEAGEPLGARINAVVTDIEMPRLDGLTLCKRIKGAAETKALPVVIFSSLINEQMSLKCKEVGADDHVTKPQMKLLVDKLDVLLGLAPTEE